LSHSASHLPLFIFFNKSVVIYFYLVVSSFVQFKVSEVIFNVMIKQAPNAKAQVRLDNSFKI
jgi:hypothetical protein